MLTNDLILIRAELNDVIDPLSSTMFKLDKAIRDARVMERRASDASWHDCNGKPTYMNGA